MIYSQACHEAHDDGIIASIGRILFKCNKEGLEIKFLIYSPLLVLYEIFIPKCLGN